MGAADRAGLWERLAARPLPPPTWQRLVDEHPPSPEQRAQGHGWDPAGLRWPAITAACTLDGAELDQATWEGLRTDGALTDHEVDLLAGIVASLSAHAVQVSLGRRLRHDPAFRLEMDYCGPRGIPHGVFAGWSEHDRDAALSWLAWSREACPSCGTRPDDWNPDQGGDLHAYTAARHTCRGCEVRERAQADLDRDRDRKKPVRLGTTVVLLPNSLEVLADGGDSVDQGARPGPVQTPGPPPARGRTRRPAAEADEGDPSSG